MNTLERTSRHSLQELTVGFIADYMKEGGIDVKEEGGACYATLALDRDMTVAYKDRMLSVSVALPVNDEERDLAILLADSTMARFNMTKIFLSEECDGLRVRFTLDTFCRTRGAFVRTIGLALNNLIASVRTFIRLRSELQGMVKRAEERSARS